MIGAIFCYQDHFAYNNIYIYYQYITYSIYYTILTVLRSPFPVGHKCVIDNPFSQVLTWLDGLKNFEVV